MLVLDPLHQLSAITAIGPDMLQARVALFAGIEHQFGSVTVLDACRTHNKRGGGHAPEAAAAGKQERQKELEQRRLRHALDQALLSGVLSGDIVLDVQPQGELLFRHKQAQPPSAAAWPAEQNGTETALP